MCLYVGNRTTGLKKHVLVRFAILPKKISMTLWKVKIFLSSKYPLCLRLPDKIQKTKNQSVHPGLRKRPKSG